MDWSWSSSVEFSICNVSGTLKGSLMESKNVLTFDDTVFDHFHEGKTWIEFDLEPENQTWRAQLSSDVVVTRSHLCVWCPLYEDQEPARLALAEASVDVFSGSGNSIIVQCMHVGAAQTFWEAMTPPEIASLPVRGLYGTKYSKLIPTDSCHHQSPISDVRHVVSWDLLNLATVDLRCFSTRRTGQNS
jgi:hypothetical protein